MAKINDKIMGCDNDGPIAGKVIDIISPQYPGQEVSYKVSWLEGYEGWLAESHYTIFDQDKWNYILKQWNIILEAKENIKDVLRN